MPLTIGYTNIFDLIGHGAQETLYFQNSATDNLEDMLTLVQPLTDKRRLLLGAQASIKAVKCFVAETAEGVMNPRQSLLKKMFLPGNAGQGSAENSISLQVQFISADKKQKKLMNMVAPWAKIFTNQDAFDNSPPGWLANWNSWQSAVIAAGMGWYRTTWSVNYIINGYTLDPTSGLVTLAFPAGGPVWPRGLNEPQKVKIRFPGKSTLDGIHVVVPLDATHAVIGTPLGTRPFSVAGTLQIPSRSFITVRGGGGQVDGIIRPQNPVRRKRGRPLLAGRGRVPGILRW